MSELNIAFIGGGQRAYLTLKNILNNQKKVKILYAILMEGYEYEKEYCDKMAKLLKNKKIEYDISEKITDTIKNKMNSYKPKVLICGGIWRSIVEKDFLDIPELGFIGLHATPLPAYRGWAGINWQIINGEKYITARMVQLDEGVDSGPLVCKKNGELFEYRINIENEKHLQEIFDDYLEIHLKAFDDLLKAILSNDISFIAQDNTKASYTCNRSPEDGEINWNQTTKTIFNFIRAQSKPYQGAFTFYNGEKVTLWKVRPREDLSNYIGRIPGKVVERNKDKKSVIILTKDSGIEILEAENDNKNKDILKIFHSVRKKCKSASEAYIEIIRKQALK